MYNACAIKFVAQRRGHAEELLLLTGRFEHLVEADRAAALTVGELGALSDLDNIAVRIADVAARLALFGYWFCDELRSSTFP